jgi:hypothetical protein
VTWFEILDLSKTRQFRSPEVHVGQSLWVGQAGRVIIDKNILFHVSEHARPSAQAPIDTNGRGGQKFGKCSNFLAISGDSEQFSFFSEKNP